MAGKSWERAQEILTGDNPQGELNLLKFSLSESMEFLFISIFIHCDMVAETGVIFFYQSEAAQIFNSVPNSAQKLKLH